MTGYVLNTLKNAISMLYLPYFLQPEAKQIYRWILYLLDNMKLLGYIIYIT